MAYTFSEAQDVIKNAEQQGLGGYVGTSLVVTQHDSRTAWSRGRLFRYADDTLGNLFHIADVSFSFYTKFSDRNMFAGQADLVGANVVRVGQDQYRAEVVLYSWGGARFNVDLGPAPNGKMLIGWGNAIGFLDSPALYCLSFNEVITGPIVIT